MVFFLELIGTVAFAISGAVVGIQKKMDIFGVAILAMTTGVGGGILNGRSLSVESAEDRIELCALGQRLS